MVVIMDVIVILIRDSDGDQDGGSGNRVVVEVCLW